MTLEEEILRDFKTLNDKNRQEVAKATAYIKLGQTNTTRAEERKKERREE